MSKDDDVIWFFLRSQATEDRNQDERGRTGPNCV
jgi:hypothetical protein